MLPDEDYPLSGIDIHNFLEVWEEGCQHIIVCTGLSGNPCTLGINVHALTPNAKFQTPPLGRSVIILEYQQHTTDGYY